MIRRAMSVAVAVGLSTPLASGCFTLHGSSPRKALGASATQVAQVEPPSRSAAIGSPYHPLCASTSGPRIDPPQGPNDMVHRPEHVPDTPTGLVPAAAKVESPPDVPVLSAEATPEDGLLTALRCLRNKRPAEAAEALKRSGQSNPEALLGLLLLASHLGQGGLEQASPAHAASLLDQLNNLSRQLRPRAELTIEKVCFCSKVRGFGDYDQLPEDYRFRAGSDGVPGELMTVYVEVRNFASEPQGEFYVTRLASRLEMHDPHGRPIWQKTFCAADQSGPGPDWTTRSRALRTDYYITFYFRVPPDAVPGRHHMLWVELEDELSQPPRKVRRSLDFEVSGGG